MFVNWNRVDDIELIRRRKLKVSAFNSLDSDLCTCYEFQIRSISFYLFLEHIFLTFSFFDSLLHVYLYKKFIQNII